MNLSSIVWTVELVEEWLQIAAQVDRALPKVGPRMAKPRMTFIRTWIELLWDELDKEKPEPKFQPTNEQVSMWEEVVLRWFALVDSEKDKKILWLRSCGLSWPRIGKKIGLERHTVTNRYKRATEDLVKALNKRKPV